MQSWVKFVITAAVVGAVIGIVVAPYTTPVILATMGFSATGPVAFTFAAAWQAFLGSVTAGSFFATLQSMAMGGAISVAAYLSTGALFGTVAGAVAMAVRWACMKVRANLSHAGGLFKAVGKGVAEAVGSVCRKTGSLLKRAGQMVVAACKKVADGAQWLFKRFSSWCWGQTRVDSIRAPIHVE